MKTIKLLYLISLIFLAACQKDVFKENTMRGVNTGVDFNQWVKVPKGTFYSITSWRVIDEHGQPESLLVGPYYSSKHLDTMDHDFEIMATEVTNEQYARFLNQALDSGIIKIIGDTIKTYYKGDPFTGYDHELKVSAGYYPVMVLNQPGLHIKYDQGRFAAEKGYENHPVVYVTWFGANAYAKFYGYRLPTEKEWERAAMGDNIRAYPWGDEINPHYANYLHGNKELRKVYGSPVRTTPVGFFNGKTYKGPYGEFKTMDNRSPYGAYDMCGNVWEWCADDYPFMHYRFMRGGSYLNYEIYAATWVRNNAEPWFASPSVGFRCVRDLIDKCTKQ